MQSVTMPDRARGSRGLALACLAVLVAVIVLSSGCASSSAAQAFRRGEEAGKRDMWDHAVLSYAKAVSLEPGSARYKLALQRAKIRAATAHFDRAKQYLASGQLELAIEELQETVLLDPSNQYAMVELQKALEERERRRRAPSDFDVAQREAEQRALELGPPKLDPASNVPLVLNFPDATVEDVYERLGKISGINILYDDKLDLNKKIEVELANVTFEKALDILMLQNRHAFKVVDPRTILIYEDTRAKRQEYEDQVIRTFYLSNAETKEIQTLLRTLLETRRVAENANLNSITMKDTPEKIKVAERIIKANDKAKGEIIVDVELLEITRNETQNLGLDLSSKSLALVFGSGEESLPLNNLSVLNSQSAWTIGPVPSVLINFLRSDSDTKSLSRPQLRLLEGEKGQILIGDRVPIPATTFNTSQTIGGNIVPVTSFTYQNVGIQLEIEPRVHFNKEITLNVKVEISALAGSVEGTGGVSQPIIGTRTVETTIRLKDGETNLLAGLIREDERVSLSGVPGLSDIPILRRLFGNTREESTETDIVVSLTPHIIRVPDIRPIDLVPLWVGTEEVIQLRGVARNALGESPFAGPSPWEEIEAELNGEDEVPGVDAEAPRIRVGGERAPREERRGRERDIADEPDFGAGPPEVDPSGGEEDVPEELDELPTPGELGGQDEEQPFSVAQVQLVAPPAVGEGQSAAVDVVISGAQDVSTVNFQLRYNPEVLSFAPPAQPGSFMLQGGVQADLQALESAEGGLIVVSLSRPPGQPASGSGSLLRLNFVAIDEGASGFAFSAAQVRGAQSQTLPASFRSSQLQVEAPQ